ncbi:hypothetical protein QR680_014686 [Steinernema hermaphroditum]|uniref:Nuclear receptor domain-containing protein n=1 Tax=Steinernema hermaphroditum TaxID=289476 RepID=A0AA39I9T9_9BILA|nr:hypothetical protein QR680_014686 [Steinernema hermaphroditum]
MSTQLLDALWRRRYPYRSDSGAKRIPQPQWERLRFSHPPPPPIAIPMAGHCMLKVRKSKTPGASGQRLCPVCESKAVDSLHYGAPVCKNCSQMFRRNIFNKDKLECRRDARLCLPGSDRPCAKCRLDRCLEVGMRQDMINIVDGQLVKSDDTEALPSLPHTPECSSAPTTSPHPAKSSRNLLTQMADVVVQIKKRNIERGRGQLRELQSSIMDIFLDPHKHFAYDATLIRTIYEKAPVFKDTPQEVITCLCDNSFPYYFIVGRIRAPTTYVDFCDAKFSPEAIRLTREQVVNIRKGFTNCSEFSQRFANIFHETEVAAITLLIMVNVSKRHNLYVDHYEAINRIEDDVRRELEDYAETDGKFDFIFRAINYFVDEVTNTARYFEEATARLKQVFPKPSNLKMTVERTHRPSPTEGDIPFYLDGYTARFRSRRGVIVPIIPSHSRAVDLYCSGKWSQLRLNNISVQLSTSLSYLKLGLAVKQIRSPSQFEVSTLS